jgi:hypothetical protein
MTGSERGPARRWLGWTAAAVLAVAAVSQTLSAQDPAPPQQQPAQPAQPDQFTFDANSMMLYFTVVETAATDFEVFMAKAKEAFNKSEKPERKSQAASWKALIKVDQPQNGTLTYIWILDPVVKGVSYDLGKAMSESLPPEEVKALFDKVGPNIKGINMVKVTMVGGM